MSGVCLRHQRLAAYHRVTLIMMAAGSPSDCCCCFRWWRLLEGCQARSKRERERERATHEEPRCFAAARCCSSSRPPLRKVEKMGVVSRRPEVFPLGRRLMVARRICKFSGGRNLSFRAAAQNDRARVFFPASLLLLLAAVSGGNLQRIGRHIRAQEQGGGKRVQTTTCCAWFGCLLSWMGERPMQTRAGRRFVLGQRALPVPAESWSSTQEASRPTTKRACVLTAAAAARNSFESRAVVPDPPEHANLHDRAAHARSSAAATVIMFGGPIQILPHHPLHRPGRLVLPLDKTKATLLRPHQAKKSSSCSDTKQEINLFAALDGRPINFFASFLFLGNPGVPRSSSARAANPRPGAR